MSADLQAIMAGAIEPALGMLPQHMDTPKARLMLLAIGLQESRFEHRVQIGGPAHGFWQFELGGGCKGVVTHQAAAPWMRKVCAAQGVPFTSRAIYDRIVSDDILAAAAARLLLYTDPKPLPAIEDAAGAWDLYLRIWRPGKPHRRTWNDLHAQAREALWL